ncbi:MAG: hypothetical protein AAFP03_17755, partial [Cyanobacteria bacterium J06598_3]
PSATAQPIFGNQALINSQDELSLVVDGNEDAAWANGWGTALRLLLDNPYLTGQSRDAQSALQGSEALPLTSQNRCISMSEAAEDNLSTSVKSVSENAFTKPVIASANQALVGQAPDSGDEIAPEADADAGENPAPLPELDMQTAPAGRSPVQPVEPAVDPNVENAPTSEGATDNSVPAPRMPAPAGVVPEQAPTANPNNFTPTGESPTPFDGTVATTLESLPDGNYRYLAGDAESRAYTNEELIQRGGSVFVLNKTDGIVTGDLLPRIGLPGICVTGSATGNTLTGAAYPYDTTDSLQDSAREIGETFEPHGSGALQIRRTQTENDGLYYADARLDVSDFTLINAGVSVPPTSCTVGRTGGRDQ